ncbi:unnamed protein product, partial [Darwinula stevensoni]
TSGYSLTAQDPYNNISRTCIEALAAVMGGTQSLHTNSLDEAIALPTDYSAKIARDTQKYLQSGINVISAIDPMGGSYYVESLTSQLVEKAWQHIQEIESLGGMTAAIEAGIPKMRIEEAAAAKQARIDSGNEYVIGVNLFKKETESELDILKVDNTKVRLEQIDRLTEIKSKRDDQKVRSTLQAITECARTGSGNLLELAIIAARERATLGEITMAMEEVFGRYKATNRTISGVYAKEIHMDAKFKNTLELSDRFAALEGRRPRIMVAKLGQDGHDRGAKIIATSFADLGFDVDMGPLFQTPSEAATQAAENDVHILGISSLAAGHKTLVPETIAALKKIGREDIMVIVGGVVPVQDYPFLFEQGVAAIFGPGTIIAEAAAEILEILIANITDHIAVNDVSFDVKAGTIFGLLGPNGAGKTSLIRIITTITGADSGQVLLNGEPLNHLHPNEIGYMPEERGLYKKMKVGEQLLYLAQLKGLTEKEAKIKLKTWMVKFDIMNWWDKKVGDLSKGMSQKIQFIATVIHDPKLLILDEPFSGLDPINANLIKDEIYQLKEKGTSILFSTHRMEQVEEI